MAEIINMPRLSDTMTEGTIAEWAKKVGDKVEKGDILAYIQTDKATMELESFKSGYLLHVGCKENESIAVDGLLAIIGEKDENIASLLAPKATSAPSPATAQASVSSSSAPSSSPAGAGETPDEVVIMPRLSDTMESGTIIKWYKKQGEPVEKGELLAEVETDKATMDLESFKNGYMLYIGVPEGGVVKVNDLVCIIGSKDKNVDDIRQRFAGASHAAPVSSPASPAPSAPEVAQTTSATVALPVQGASSNERVKSSPLARKIASEKNIDLTRIVGTGENGRVVKRDIEGASASVGMSSPQVASSAPSTASTSSAKAAAWVGGTMQESFVDTPASQMRSVIAKRLVESKQQVPHFYLKMDVVVDELLKQRQLLNEISPVKISVNDILILIVAKALRAHPEVNTSWVNNTLRSYGHVHIGSAVAVTDGLVVPVVKFADQKGLVQIATETKELYKKAKDKKLQLGEMTGGTFTISNLGMMDIDDFSAIINPPESCILAIGKTREVVVKRGTGFEVEQHMSLTLSCDHRVVDGAVGAGFLQTIKRYIQTPLTIML